MVTFARSQERQSKIPVCRSRMAGEILSGGRVREAHSAAQDFIGMGFAILGGDMNEDEKIVLNGEQEAALGVMMSGANVFLTGEAGTGKSTLVREFLRRCERECVPLVRSVVSGAGVKEEELATIQRLISKYGSLPQAT